MAVGEAGGDELLGMDVVVGEEEIREEPLAICCARVSEEPKVATILMPVACSYSEESVGRIG